MKATLKAVNSALENVSTVRNMYAPQGSTELPKIGYIERAVARISDDGDVHIKIYAYGEAKASEDYYWQGTCCDVEDIIIAWAFPWITDLTADGNCVPSFWDAKKRRKEAVMLIAQRLNDLSSEADSE